MLSLSSSLALSSSLSSCTHGLDEGESFLLDLGDGRFLEEGMGQHGVGPHEEHGVLAELVQLGLLLFVRQRIVVLNLLRSLDELGLLFAELRLLLLAGAVVLRHLILLGSKSESFRGGSRIFMGEGGGGRKRLCARTHITSAEPKSLSAGVQGPLKGPGSSRVVLLLYRAI